MGEHRQRKNIQTGKKYLQKLFISFAFWFAVNTKKECEWNAHTIFMDGKESENSTKGQLNHKKK